MTGFATHATLLERRHWVFDLDGTLTLPVHDFAAMRRVLGMPEGVDMLAWATSQPEPEATRLRAELDRLEAEYARHAAPAAGALALLEALAARGARLGLLTRNTREVALEVLGVLGVRGLFDEPCVLGRWQAPPKPRPDGLLALVAGWDADIGDVLMVGDYLFDLQCGRAAGVATVHVDTSRRFPWPEHADLMVGGLDELHARLP